MNETIKALLKASHLSARKAQVHASYEYKAYYHGQMDLATQLYLSLFNEHMQSKPEERKEHQND